MNREELPSDSFKGKYILYDYIDSYTRIASCRKSITAKQFFDLAFNQPSYWRNKLI